ncbi:hypothetical protein BW425_05275 [Bacillus pseudomycoides]|uniref:Uncharacterized protein n=1 Tax=Bacillus pseudomycoides TaxID=64104 RepID=A0A1Y3MMD2_9BACI|nr:hypothetical protein BW425_05275 [Bacillus pseudomycoides]PEK70686.1 hypothetical protein CN590_08320 [Bacillus pseudomycoides]PEL33527.1 hypothetical protein CN608_02645 [Bacillus pseudomycoides]PGE85228.1 hypothetical protein COM55_13670 [Bacillus pseudomycoides]
MFCRFLSVCNIVMKYLPTVKNSKRHVDYCQGLCGNLNMSKILRKKNQGACSTLILNENTYIILL